MKEAGVGMMRRTREENDEGDNYETFCSLADYYEALGRVEEALDVDTEVRGT